MSSPTVNRTRTQARIARKRARANARQAKRATLHAFAPVMRADDARAAL